MNRLITGLVLGVGSSLAWHVGRWIAKKRKKAAESEEPLELLDCQRRPLTNHLHDTEDGVADNAWDR